jgi:hypothetical protein
MGVLRWTSFPRPVIDQGAKGEGPFYGTPVVSWACAAIAVSPNNVHPKNSPRGAALTIERTCLNIGREIVSIATG